MDILSVHVPSLVGRSIEKTLPTIHGWSGALEGTRRHAILTGMHTSIELDCPWPRTIGFELVRDQAVRCSQSTEDIKVALATEMEQRHMKAINTCESWPQHVNSDLGEDGNGNGIRSGVLLGRPTTSAIDYIIRDERAHHACARPVA